MPIATTDKRLISICGSQREASRLIKFMINIGLLTEENKDYKQIADELGCSTKTVQRALKQVDKTGQNLDINYAKLAVLTITLLPLP